MKVIVTSTKIITPSKDYVGLEHELAAALDIQEYQIIEADAAPDFTTEAERAQQSIASLEAQITPRRLREAVLGNNGWLAAKEVEIAALRASL